LECDTQVEIDTYWNTLTEGERGRQCGWLKDNLCGKLYPTILGKLMSDPSKSGQGNASIYGNEKKFDIAVLEIKHKFDIYEKKTTHTFIDIYRTFISSG
jgi:predicted 3-demethylubiquinone-9 3-methyltransferase (glyoxalase superfamily)